MIELGLFVPTQITSALGGDDANVYDLASCILHAVDDDSCAVFCAHHDSNPTQPHEHRFYVVDASGAFTCYSTGFINANYFQSLIPMGNGNFLVTFDTGPTYFLSLKNQKLNNSSPILVLPGKGVSNSCAAVSTLNGVFYDGVRQLVAAAFYPGFAACSTIYEADPATGNLALINQGYVGPANNGKNPFNLLSQSFPAGWQESAWTSNGLSVVLGVQPAGNRFIFASRQGVSINKGNVTNDCVTPNGSYVTAAPGAYVVNSPKTVGASYWHLTSNISGLFGLAISNDPTIRLSDHYVFGDGPTFHFQLQLTAGILTDFAAHNVLITNKHVFCLAEDPNRTGSGNNNAVYVVSIPGIYNGPSGVVRHSIGLVNGARPISLTGKYKA